MLKELKKPLMLITYGILLYVLLTNYMWIGNLISKLFHILLPFIIGMVIAYVLNILVNMLENKPLKKMKKGKRALSVTLSLLIVISFIIILLSILIPQIENAGTIFIDNLPEYSETLTEIGTKFGLSEEELSVLNFENSTFGKELISKISTNYDSIIDIGVNFASSLFSGIVNTFIGIVFAVYLLIDKENLSRQAKRIFKKFMKEDHYNKLIEISTLSNSTLTSFLKVQCLEACILGTLCLIGMLILGIPYAGTISAVVGFTALIPIFGAFVGLVIGAFLIFMVSPIKALTFIIFFLILQQLENNLIYPRVVGGKIGLPSIWVLVAVTVGGSLFGVFGMLLGVPIFSVIYTLAKVNLKDN